MGDEKGLNLLDIIIVNYNTSDYLTRCLRSIYDSLDNLSATIFVQDNGSVDNVERMTSLFPEVILSKNASNIGYAKAVNKVLQVSSASYAVLLNPDSYVMKDFFENALSYMKENSQVGILGPKILNSDGSVQGSARSFPSPITGLFGRNTLLTRWFPNNRFSRKNILTKRSDGISPIEVDWVSGACMVVRKAAIKDVGLLDERFFLYWEDADWCKRMWESGWKIVYCPQVKVMHYVGKSSEKSPLRATMEFHKSAYRLFAKHARGVQRFALPVVMWALAVRLILSISWYTLHRWWVRIRGQMQLKDGPPPDA